jgi:hypothetical protein
LFLEQLFRREVYFIERQLKLFGFSNDADRDVEGAVADPEGLGGVLGQEGVELP